MIFVTTGTSSWDFSRLIIKMDEIADRFDEEVIMQIGESIYEPCNAKYFRYIPKEEMEKYYLSARVIVSHAGVGSILTAVEFKKQIIIVPRRKLYNELFDDHQLDISKELENNSRFIIAWDLDDLENQLIHGEFEIADCISKEKNNLIMKLSEYLKGLGE